MVVDRVFPGMCPQNADRYTPREDAATVLDRAGGPAFPPETELVEYFRDRIRVFAARRFGDAVAAEDIAQETLRRVLEAVRAGRIRDPSALASFVFQTARHVCLHRARSVRRRARAFARLARRSPTPDALGTLVTRERRLAVAQALERLTERDRTLLRMLFYEDLTTAEAARRLRITRGAVRVRKHRALKRLAALLVEPE